MDTLKTMVNSVNNTSADIAMDIEKYEGVTSCNNLGAILSKVRFRIADVRIKIVNHGRFTSTQNA
ncbi:hypothetical protein DPMN_113204 [Dreissena polymorpha]|uniref:Uncharacterized protein n=1 Tax=Dreissena polymorpha TaxID=45954 RepID=A0A9D4KH32_DREPO|nr:hypothetical protein DPMN_113204 [Dreissena polymorpha]